MALTSSTMLPLGSKAPGFELPNTAGKLVSLNSFEAPSAYLVIFLCNHCPFVKHIRGELARLANDYIAKGVAVVGISSNDPVAYPDDGPEKMAEEAREAGYSFPYLFDETQDVAKAYEAACTPDFYVFDASRTLVYRGRLDASRPGNGVPITGEDLRRALDATLARQPADLGQKPSMGCNIKWKPGNAPTYFG